MINHIYHKAKESTNKSLDVAIMNGSFIWHQRRYVFFQFMGINYLLNVIRWSYMENLLSRLICGDCDKLVVNFENNEYF